MKQQSTVLPRDLHALDWSPHSFEDPGGRVFRKEGRIYRALKGKSFDAFCRLEAAGLLPALVERNIVSANRTELSVDGYEMVVEHELLPSSPLVSEWTTHMLYDVAMLFLEQSEFLAKHGYQFQDSHGWNYMFRSATATCTDFSSIIPFSADEKWKPLDEFLACFWYPLELARFGAPEYAFFLLGTQYSVSAEATSIGSYSLCRWLQRRSTNRLYQRLCRLQNKRGPQSVLEICHVLKSLLVSIRPGIPVTRWSEYSVGFPEPDAHPNGDWNQKQKSVHRVLSGLKPNSLLDIGCNSGWYSVLAEKLGFTCHSMDSDRSCVEQVYMLAKDRQLRITPICATPFRPNASHGPRFYDSLESRFSADVVMLLAVAHHLYFKQGYSPGNIVSLLERFTKSVLILEYVPEDDYWVKRWCCGHSGEEYSEANWIRELKRYFHSVEILPSEYSHISSTVQRKLLIATR
jgi:hypothetical protein